MAFPTSLGAILTWLGLAICVLLAVLLAVTTAGVTLTPTVVLLLIGGAYLVRLL